MKKIILVSFVLFFCFIGLASAVEVSINNYYPTPAEAGSYFNVWLNVANPEGNLLKDAVIRFKESYPFSLDPTDEKEIITSIAANSAVTKQFKVRVDQQAKEGSNNLLFEYADCPSCVFIDKSMTVSVVEYQTTFDVVLQEITADGAFIALANIGKNSANAITVRIPEQDYFKTDLTSASIVGNLASGDYTIAGFKISPKQAVQTGVVRNQTSQRKTGFWGIFSKQESVRPMPNLVSTGESKDLIVQIDYTDVFGVRRTVVKKLSLNPALLTGTSINMVAARAAAKSNSSFMSDKWFWVSAVLAVVIAGMLLKKYKKRKHLKE